MTATVATAPVPVFDLVPNTNAHALTDRALNAAVATYTTQLRQLKRDLDVAEAQAISIALSLGTNAEDRKRNTVLYLSGDPKLVATPEQAAAVERYSGCLVRYDAAQHDLAYLEAEQQTRRHQRVDELTSALRGAPVSALIDQETLLSELRGGRER